MKYTNTKFKKGDGSIVSMKIDPKKMFVKELIFNTGTRELTIGYTVPKKPVKKKPTKKK